MVGNSTCLATSDFLVGFCVFVKGPYSLWCSFMFGWWDFHLDFSRVHIASFSFSHENKKLLVLSISSSLTYIHRWMVSSRTYWWCHNNLFQGKHSTLSTSWLSSQASNGWTQTCLPTCCNSYLKCAGKFHKWDYPLQICILGKMMCLLLNFNRANSLCMIYVNELNASCYELIYVLLRGTDWIMIDHWPQLLQFNPNKSTDFERWDLSFCIGINNCYS